MKSQEEEAVFYFGKYSFLFIATTKKKNLIFLPHNYDEKE